MADLPAVRMRVTPVPEEMRLAPVSTTPQRASQFLSPGV